MNNRSEGGSRLIPDFAAGVLVGLAAGDRNLGPTEMALRLAESLLANDGLDCADVLDRWYAWWVGGAWDTGHVFDQTMAAIDRGVDGESASAVVHQALAGMTAGCNGAHRVPVVAGFALLGDDEIDHAAASLTLLTHQHQLAVDTAVAVTRVCRSFAQGAPLDDAYQEAVRGLSREVRTAVKSSFQRPAGRGGYSPIALQSALHFVATRENFASALEDSLRYAGMPNYCPVLVGAIAGARWGVTSIDDQFLDHCKDRRRVLKVAADLAAIC